MMKKFFAILIIGLFNPWSSDAQLSTCKSKLQAIYAGFNQVGQAVPIDKRYYMDYSIETELRQAKNQSGIERIKVVMSSDAVMLTSPHMELYENMQYAFMVLPVEKTVKWTKSTKKMGANVKAGLANKMMDSLFRYSNVLSCETTNYHGAKSQKIILQCTPRGEKLTNYKTVTFWTDEAYEKLLRVNMVFGNQGDYKSADLIFYSIDFNYTGDLHPIDFEKTYIKSGQLSGKYQNYKLFDLRNKKR